MSTSFMKWYHLIESQGRENTYFTLGKQEKMKPKLCYEESNNPKKAQVGASEWV